MKDDSSRHGSAVSDDSRPHGPHDWPDRQMTFEVRTRDGVGIAVVVVALPALFAFTFWLGLGRRGWFWIVLVAVALLMVVLAPLVLAVVAQASERRRRDPLRLTAQRAATEPGELRSAIDWLTSDLSALTLEFAEASGQAEELAHPLLAREFRVAGERLAELRRQVPGSGPAGDSGDIRWMVKAQSLIRPGGYASRRRLHRRLRAARLAYRWNLPLTRGAAANFAVATMAARIDRLTGSISGYLTPAQPAPGGSDV
jgi:hypothetical protein